MNKPKITLYSFILPLLCYVPFAFDKSLNENIFLFIFYCLTLFFTFRKKDSSSFVRAVLLLVGGLFYFVTFEKIRSLDGGVFLITFLSVLKLWEMKSVRDYYLLILILILSLVGHMLNVDSLYFLFYAIFLLAIMFYSMISVRFEGRFQAIDLRRLNGYFFYALLLTLILFFLFPRFKVNSFNAMDTTIVAQSGFSEELNPGSVSRLIQSDEVVFRARFVGNFPPIPEIYWRGISFDINKGLSWEKGKLLVEKYDHTEDVIYDYLVDYENRVYGPLFTLGHYDQLKMLSSGRVQKVSGGIYSIYPYGREKIRYKGVVYKESFTPLKSDVRKRFLQIPKGEEDLKDFIEKKIKRSTDIESINSFLTYLTKNNFVYSTSPGEIKNLSEFFFNEKKGFCEHYAALMAYSLRAMGIPARIISGYQGGDYNAIGDYFIIREKDAHAWVEGWIEGRGWQRFDPVNAVAPERLRIGASLYYDKVLSNNKSIIVKFLSQMGFNDALLIFDGLFYNLNTYFVNFDKETQEKLFQEIFGNKITQKNVGLVILLVILAFFIFLFYINRDQNKDIYKLINPILDILEKDSRMPRNENEAPLIYLERISSATDKNYEDYKNVLSLFNKCYFCANPVKSDFVTLKKEIKSLIDFNK